MLSVYVPAASAISMFRTVVTFAIGLTLLSNTCDVAAAWQESKVVKPVTRKAALGLAAALMVADAGPTASRPRRRCTSTSPAVAARTQDRKLKVTFGANNPAYFDLPDKLGPRGTPLFGGSKQPRTLFKAPKRSSLYKDRT